MINYYLIILFFSSESTLSSKTVQIDYETCYSKLQVVNAWSSQFPEIEDKSYCIAQFSL